MKLKATKKEMRDGYYYIMSVSYCSMQSLLREQTPFAYSTRTEGWACDYYDIEGVLISEGYAPLASKNMKKQCNAGRATIQACDGGQCASRVNVLARQDIPIQTVPISMFVIAKPRCCFFDGIQQIRIKPVDLF